MSPVIKVTNLSKIYRLGEIGTGTISRDLERWYKMRIRGQADPFLKIGETNQRDKKGISDVVYALRDINFEVQQGEALGIIGKNGAGKSTLLKILSRVTSPTTGSIKVKGRVASLLEVGTGFHPELTGRENIFLNGAILGMRKNEIIRKMDEIIEFSGVERYIDTPVKRYSSGMYVRLAFAVAAHLESEILIVDEVLAVGDAEFQKKCLGKMGEVSRGDGRTVLFVSHNLTAVQQLCEKGMVINDGSTVFYGETNNAIRSYLNDVRKTILWSDLSKRTDRKGSQWLKFTKVVICDTKGNELQKVISGQDLVIQLYYESEKEKSNVSVLASFNVRNSQSYLLTNLNSVDTGHSKLDIYRNGYFECCWPKFNLKSDVYDCNLFCSVNGEIVDWLQGAFVISVEDGDYFQTGKMIGREQGEILVNHSWSSCQINTK